MSPNKYSPSDVEGEYNLTESLSRKLRDISQELHKRMFECQQMHSGIRPVKEQDASSQERIVEWPNYEFEEDYKAFCSAYKAANTFSDEIQRQKISIFDGQINIQAKHGATGDLGDMLYTPGKVEALHDFIRNELKDEKLAKTIRLLAVHFREANHDGNYVPADPKRQFAWEEERVLTLEERLRSLRARLMCLDKSSQKQLHELVHPEITERLLEMTRYLTDLSKGIGVSQQGIIIATRPVVDRIKIKDTAYQKMKPDVNGLCGWIDQHYSDIDPTLSRDIKNLIKVPDFHSSGK